MIRRPGSALACGLLVLVLAALYRLSTGSMTIPLASYLDWCTGQHPLPTHISQIISLRLQRTLMLILVGAALACAGAVYQAALRNMLADPFILGISAGAALASAATITWSFSLPALLGLSAGFTLARDLPLAAFLGALLPLFFLHAIYRVRPDSMVTLILGGVALNSFLSATLTLIMYFSRNLRNIYGWLLGSVTAGDPYTLMVTAGVVLSCCLALYSRSGILNLMLLDERVAASLGIDPDRERLLLITLASVAVAAAVAVSGMIGFVGLLIPHAARFLGGADHRVLLPFSFLLGGAALCLCDGLAHILIPGMIIPVGVITSFFGAPFFILLLVRRS